MTERAKDAKGTKGVELIRRERKRQLAEEGWTPEHDDEHADAEMADAAACYTVTAANQVIGLGVEHDPPSRWPWLAKWWKPSDDSVRNLVKAGALIAAEIDRHLRQRGGPCPGCNDRGGTYHGPGDWRVCPVCGGRKATTEATQ